VKLNKKGKLTTNTLNTVVLGIVILVVLFASYAAIIPDAQTAGDSMNDSIRCVDVGCVYTAATPAASLTCINGTGAGNITCQEQAQSIPLSGLFSGTGVVFVIVMAALLILVVKGFMSSNK